MRIPMERGSARTERSQNGMDPGPDYFGPKAGTMAEVNDPKDLPEDEHHIVEYTDVDPYSADHRDYVLLQSRVNLMNTSQMSDLKANLMLTLSAVMLQFALGKIGTPESSGHRAPLWVVAVGALLTIIFSAWSTLPRIRYKRPNMPEGDRLPPGSNLLFFGNFIGLSLLEYKRWMARMLSSPPRTHDAILEELHAHGRFIVMHKFLPLRLAYLSFLLTLAVSALLYAAM
ncbi:MAG: hypothetical protein H6595_02125 [Flavobacteriales bacterium]|nr:hypothetical protein [Flavobacteriales bacterium]MCB9166255.1 hypothetical protein [Flavobacteriales bacterium]